MNQKKLSLWLKAIIIGVGICGLVIYLGILPNLGDALHGQYPEFAAWHWPWLIFLWITAIPCYAILVLAWKIASNIGNDCSFSADNANLLQYIAWLIAGDILFFFLGNAVFFFLSMNHPGMLLGSLVIDFLGVSVSVGCAALSHLVQKAAEMKAENDLTI